MRVWRKAQDSDGGQRIGVSPEDRVCTLIAAVADGTTAVADQVRRLSDDEIHSCVSCRASWQVSMFLRAGRQAGTGGSSRHHCAFLEKAPAYSYGPKCALLPRPRDFVSKAWTCLRAASRNGLTVSIHGSCGRWSCGRRARH